MKKFICILGRCMIAAATLGAGHQCAMAAHGEMGVGIPSFGMYSAATGVQVIVWGLANPSVAFPSGCSYITLNPGTMGMDSYKLAYATLLLAKSTNKPIRFYAHAERDSGCGVDYLQLTD